VPAYGYVRQTLDGPLDAARVGRAFAVLAARHPMLRMRLVGPEPRQVIAPPATVDVAPPWFSEVSLRTTPEQLDEDLCNRPIDLFHEAPLRAVLARESPGVSHLVIVGHHAAVDGYSLHLLCQELWSIYRDGAGPVAQTPFAGLPVTPASTVDTAYWRRALATYPAGLALPYDGDPSAAPAPPLVTHRVATDASALREAAADAGVSLFHLVLASYLRCLATWTGQERVAVTVARAGRDARVPGIGALIGPLADVLPVAVEVGPADDVRAVAARVRAAWLESERHGSVSGVDIGRLAPAGGAGLRTAGFSFARFPVTVDTDGLPPVTATAAGTGSAATRLSLLAWELDGSLHLSWTFPLALFRRETVARLATEHLATLAAAAGERPAAAGERRPGIVRRVLDRCATTPDAVAVDPVTGPRLTYRDLDRESGRLAAALAARSAGTRVGLLTRPGVDTVVGVLGVLRSGAAYVPVDATHPPGRLRDQLDRAGVRLVVCHAATADAAAAIGLERLDLSETGAATSTVDAEPGDLAYVMFTSGSTGRPKAVPVTHAALATYLDWAVDTFGYGPDDRMLQVAPICFDASVRQILAPLLAGATVVPVDRDLLRDPDALLRLLERGRITVWSSVPSLWERLLAAAERRADRPDLSALRWVHVGGEPLAVGAVRRWFDLFGAGAPVTNLYGPTETTINATYHVVARRPADDDRSVPIGRPAAGALLRVVDDDGRPADKGELLIGGPGVSPGYLDDSERTAAAFRWRDGRRWYASGDVVRRRPDGVLEFVGRRDDQVKVRGHRVEPGETEAVLRGHPDVEHAAVLPDGTRLVAYAQPRAGTDPDLRAYLRERLPEYLVPARIHVLAAMPMTSAGKVDRGRLVGTDDADATGGPPRGVTEKAVAAAWSRLLGVDRVGREDDFFALGGDSILALDLFAHLADEFPGLPRPTAIYRHRTVRALAAAIDAARGGPEPEPRVPERADTPFPLTASQRGFLLAEALDPAGNHGWLARIRLRGPLDRDRFQRAVDALVERHGMLRTVFPAGARPPVQQELPAALRLPVGFDTSDVDGVVAAERMRRFEPWAWPLIRLRLVRVGPEEHVLVVHAHHLIGDGYSAALLGRELLDRYRDPDHRPPPPRSTFRDFVAVAGTGPTLRPRAVRAPGGAVREHTGVAESRVDGRTVAGLRRLAAAHGASVHGAVLTAYVRALRRHTGRADPAVGVATTGRDHPLPDLTRLFGPCVTAVVVRPVPATGFVADLRAVAAALETAHDTPADGEVDAFLTYLDFTSLTRPTGPGELTAEWEPDTELDPPAAGAEVVLAARPTDDGLLFTVRAALPPDRTRALADAVGDELTDAVKGRARRRSWAGTLDAALIGYLPSPAHLAAMAGLPTNAVPRDRVRAALFPGGAPRLLEVAETALGRSGYVCLPRFADELSTVDGLAAEVTRAVGEAHRFGARGVSLAGMLPSLTGYGFALGDDDSVTTGHAATAVAVAGTVVAALSATGRAPGTIAFLGVGSIGRAALNLVLARLPERPDRVLLCDLPATVPVLEELGRTLTDTGHRVSIGDWSDADLIVAATSASTAPLRAEDLRPGTIVVDDSFPPAIDPVAALDRMRLKRDVLVVGGGLLAVGAVDRVTAPDLPPDVVERYAAQPRVPGTLASCQVESLARAADPGLPRVRGLVEPEVAAAYASALDRLGVGTAPPHLMHHVIDPATLRLP
jgi:amino acid adenylation domain-containing protein